jgi:hypothetical protein
LNNAILPLFNHTVAGDVVIDSWLQKGYLN